MRVIISSSKTPIQTTKNLVVRFADGSYISADQLRGLGFLEQIKIKTIKRPEMYYEVENATTNVEVPLVGCSSLKPSLHFEGTVSVAVKISDPVAAIVDGAVNINDEVVRVIKKVAQKVLLRFDVEKANQATSVLMEELEMTCINQNQGEGFKSYLKVVVGAVHIYPDKKSLEFLRTVEESGLKREAIKTEKGMGAISEYGDAMIKKVADVVEDHHVQQLIDKTNMLGHGGEAK